MDDYMSKEQKEFEFPQSVLNQLNEFSSAGYFLLVFDECGRPQIMSNFDNEICARSAQHYLNTWTQALAELQLQSEMQNILESVNSKKKKKK